MSIAVRIFLLLLCVGCGRKLSVGDTQLEENEDTAADDTGRHIDDHVHDVEVVWDEIGSTPAGDFNAIAVSPHDPNQVYLGSDKSGLFISSSETPSFERSGAFSGPSPHVLQPVVELPDMPGVLILNSLHDLWLSEDGGLRYHLIPEFSEMSSGVMGVAALPGLVVVAEANGHVWSTTDLFASVSYAGFVVLDPGGKDWVADKPAVFPALIDSNTWLLSVRGGGVLRTENAGLAWTSVIDVPVDHDSLVVHGMEAMVATNEGVLHSVDGGQNWELLDGSPGDCQSMSWSSPTVAAVCGELLFISPNDGIEWSEHTLLTVPLSVSVAPSDPSTVFVGGVSSAMWSHDRGETFDQTTEGLVNSDIAHFAAHPEDTEVVIAGTQCLRGFYRSTDGAESWEYVESEGHYVMGIKFAPSDPNVLYGCDADSVFRSDDGGRTMRTLTRLPPGVTHPHGMSIHPQDTERLLVGTSDRTASDGELYVPQLVETENGGDSWNVIGAGLPTGDIAFVSVEHDPHDPERIWVGAGPGGVFHDTGPSSLVGEGLWISEDGGENFSQATGLPEGLHVLNIAFDPHQQSRLLVATHMGLYRSEDDGASWTCVVPGESIGGVVWHPELKGAALASHGTSVWVSMDGGETWADLGDHEPHGDARPDGSGSMASGLELSSDGQILYVGSGVMGSRRGHLRWSLTHPGE